MADVNDPPSLTSVPVLDATQDVLYTYDVDATDPDAGDTLTFSFDLSPAGMTIDPTTGLIQWTPTNADVGAAHPVTVRVTDTGGLFDTQSFDVAVANVNDAPLAEDDAYATDEDAPLTVAGPGVLGNDSDPDGDSLTAAEDTAPTNGSVTLNSDGSLTYQPDPDFNGTDTFTYHVNDGVVNSNSATVTITVNALNDPPVAVADSANTPEDVPVAVAVLVNDTDVDGDDVWISSFDTPSAGGGTVSLDENGTPGDPLDDRLLYTPAPNYVGMDSFAYAITDGVELATATVTVDVGDVNDAPVARDDAVTTPEDTAIVISVLIDNGSGPDTDVDGTIDPATVAIGAAPLHGTAVANGDGTVTYTPDPNWNDDVTGDAFTYTVADDLGEPSNPAVVTVRVTPVNDEPVAVADTANTDEDLAVAVDVVANDTDVDGDDLWIEEFYLTSAEGGAITRDDNGTPGDPRDDRLVYTPGTNFVGLDTFTYQVTDGVLVDTATVTIDVGGVNDAPVAENDSVTTPEDTPVVISVLLDNGSGPDTDPDGTLVPTSVLVETPPAHGTAVANPAGTVTYTPAADYFDASVPDTFTYTVADDVGERSNPAVVSVTVTPVNDPPVAVGDSATTPEDVPVSVDVLANDTDADGDDLSIEQFDPASAEGGTISLEDQGTPDPTDDRLVYSPAPGFFGTDTFTYEVTDGALSATGTVTIEVDAVNDPPTAQNDATATAEDTPVTVDAVANDTDPDGDPLSIFTFDTVSAQVGAVSLDDNGTPADATDDRLVYTPAPDFCGLDTFTYGIVDLGGVPSYATVTVDVSPVNDPPTLSINAGLVVGEGGTGTITPSHLSGTDHDDGGPDLTYTVTTSPIGGHLELTSAPGTPVAVFTQEDIDNSLLAYVHDGLGALDDSFEFTLSDGGEDGALPVSGTFTIGVTPVNDPPVFVGGPDENVLEDPGPQTVAGWATAIDPGGPDEGGQVLAFVVTDNTNPALFAAGPAVASDGTLTYTPAPGANGSADITIELQDDGGGADTSAPFTFTVFVAPVNDPPTFTGGPDQSIPEDSAPQTVAGWATNLSPGPGDETGQSLTFSVTANTNPALFAASPGVSPVGTLTYTPAPGANGSADITIVLRDDGGTANGGVDTSAPFTFTLTVAAVNDLPVAEDDSVTTPEDTPVVIPVLLDNGSGADTDPDGTLVAASVLIETPPTHGAAVAHPDGTVTYTPDPDYFDASVPDTFTYSVADGMGGRSDPATVSVTVTPINDPPVAVDDSEGTWEDTPLAVDVLANDHDVDGDPLAISSFDAGSVEGGTIVLDDRGTPDPADDLLEYTPDPGFYGIDSFTYAITDGAEYTVATVTVDVGFVNDPPVAQDDAVTTDEDTPVSIAVLDDNGSGPDDDVDGTLDPASVTIMVPPAGGTADPQTDGTVTYTPNPGFNGPDSFTYTVADDLGAFSNEATVTIAVTPVDDLPVAADDPGVMVVQNLARVIDVLANDQLGDPPTTITAVTQGTAGTVAVDPGGASVTYTPDTDYVGPDSFTYTIEDADGQTSGAAVALEVTAENHTPLAIPDGPIDVTEDLARSIDVLANDGLGDEPTAIVAVTHGAHGSVGIDPGDGSLTYLPDPDYFGPDSFTYTIRDVDGENSTAGVTVTVLPVNDTPLAQDDGPVAVTEDLAETIGVLLNDDLGDTPTLVTAVTQGTAGSVAIGPGSTSVIYTPEADYVGLDDFTYTIRDADGEQSVATVAVDVQNVNDPPVAADDAYPVPQGAPATLDVLANDSDPDPGDNLWISAVGGAPTGTVVNNGSTLTYTPAAGFVGTDTLTYTAADAAGATASAGVTVTVIDATPPTVLLTEPPSGGVGAADVLVVPDLIVAWFSEAMDPATVNSGTFRVSNETTPALIGGVVTYAKGVATFTPTSPLDLGTTYRVTLTTGIRDAAGVPLPNPYTWTFNTPPGPPPDDLPPLVLTTNPPRDRAGVAANTAIAAWFSEPLAPGAVDGSSFRVNRVNGSTRVPVVGTVAYAATADAVTATFTPATALAYETTYEVTISATATDLAGNSMPHDYVWSFTTRAAPGTNLPAEIPVPDPTLQANPVMAVSEVTLRASPFVDPDGDDHEVSIWEVRRADQPDGDPVVVEVVACTDVASRGELTACSIAGLDPGLQYVWRVGYVDSGSGEPTWSETSRFTVGTSERDSSVQVASGTTVEQYRMVSFTQWMDDPAAAAVFGPDVVKNYQADFRIGTYDPIAGGYVEYPNGLVEPGRAYWFLARYPFTANCGGVQCSLDTDVDVGLKYNGTTGDGWNMIGNPNHASYNRTDVEVLAYDGQGSLILPPTPIGSLPADNPYVGLAFWHWEMGGYNSNVAVLEAHEGYWVQARAPRVYLRFPLDAQTTATAARVSIPSAGRIAARSGDTPPAPMGALSGGAGAGTAAGGGGAGGCFLQTVTGDPGAGEPGNDLDLPGPGRFGP
ncbi:MAG: Ig-like domain-containing protein [Deferrisomatales bacterium]|nr:Ig-like domain-containing protein [Deferrisomatales bacterium]